MRFGVAFLILALIIACKNKNASEPVAEEDAVQDSILVWETNVDSMTMIRDTTIPDSLITINRIINGLNARYPEVQIIFVKQSGDTAFTKVPDAEYLGEQMGDAGAANWFADAVINLTAVPGVNFVSFQMDTQSHASSGVISRENYKDWKRE